MGLHIEISGTLEPREWDAIATIAHLMGGTVLAAGTALPLPPVAAPRPQRLRANDVVTETETETEAETETVTPPPPPPPPSATETTKLPSPAEAAGVILDSAGLPWDARIHASSRTTTKDAKWTSKRNLDPAMKASVEAELRQIMAAAPPPPPPPTTDADIAAAFPAAGVDPAPIAPTPPPPPPPAADTTAMGDTPFQALMKKILARQAAGTLTTEIVAHTAQLCGLTGITALANRPDLIPTFEAMLPV